MRLWENPFTEEQLALITIGLQQFKAQLEQNYLQLFKEIEIELNKK